MFRRRLILPLIALLITSALFVLAVQRIPIAIQFNGSPQSVGGSVGNVFIQKYATSEKRVAICMGGAARTFHYDGVHNNILNHAIVPLQRQGYQVDVFFLVRMTDDAAPMQLAARTNTDKVYKALKLFNATKVIEYSSLSADHGKFEPRRFTDRTENKHAFYKPPEQCKEAILKNATIHFSHALYRTQQCLSVITDYEDENRFHYHWLYHLRPDVVYMGDDLPAPDKLSSDILYTSAWSGRFVKELRGHIEFFKLENDTMVEEAVSSTAVENQRKNVGDNTVDDDQLNGVGDQLLSASRKLAQVAFNAFGISEDCLSYMLPNRNSESLFLLYLLKKRVRYAPLPVLWDIIRDHPDPFCMGMKYKTLPNTTYGERKKRCHEFWDININDLPQHNQ